MKKLGWILVCLAAVPGFTLEISEQGRQEAQLFNTFLQAMYEYPHDAARAFKTLQAALALSPDSKYLRQLLVSAALAAGQSEQAAAYLDFIDTDEKEPEDWAVYAAYHVQTGQPKEALAAYEKAVALAPDNNELLYRYLVLLSGTDFEKTVQVLEKTAQEQPDLAAQSYTQIARLYLRRQQQDAALKYLDKAVKADGNDPAPRLLKADIYEKTGQYFLMLHEFEELEKIGYGNAGVFARMGAVFLVVKDMPKAEEYFLKAKQADPHDPATNYFLSILAEEKGDLAGAVTYLQDAQDYPENASRWLQVSFLQQKLNQPQVALQTLANAYKRFKDNVEIGFFYGLLLNDNKQYKQAARVLKKLTETRPDYIDARLHYAYALESLQKYKEMETHIRFILDQQPQHAPALNLLAYSLAERGVRLDEAQELITRALAVAPTDVSFMDTLGWIYIKQNKLDEAEQIFSSLPAGVLTQYPEIAYHVGVLRWQQGRLEEALRYLEQAQSGWPAAEKLYKRLNSH